jgi:ferredoxin
MIKKVQKLAREYFQSGKVEIIYGLKKHNNKVVPSVFNKEDELKDLVISAKEPLLNICRPSKKNIIRLIEEKYPEAKIGMVVRGCDERILIELSKRKQIKLDNIELIGVACNKEDAIACNCPKPYPVHLDIGTKVDGVIEDKKNKELLNKKLSERLSFWQYQFSKCIKCYGCRNACPLCFCKDCAMEQQEWTKTGEIPPEIPMFHFIRFYHLADRCIDCGECEAACPVDIPLLTISKQIRNDIKDLFDYESGLDAEQESPLLTSLDEVPMKEGESK